MMAATRARTSSPGSLVAIHGIRILEHRLDGMPFAVVEAPIEAALAPGVAGDAAEGFDEQQDRIAIAVEADLVHVLDMTRTLALAPQRASGPRPIVRLTRVIGPFERFAVHPCERQHTMRGGILCDGRDQSVVVP